MRPVDRVIEFAKKAIKEMKKPIPIKTVAASGMTSTTAGDIESCAELAGVATETKTPAVPISTPRYS